MIVVKHVWLIFHVCSQATPPQSISNLIPMERKKDRIRWNGSPSPSHPLPTSNSSSKKKVNSTASMITNLHGQKFTSVHKTTEIIFTVGKPPWKNFHQPLDIWLEFPVKMTMAIPSLANHLHLPQKEQVNNIFELIATKLTCLARRGDISSNVKEKSSKAHPSKNVICLWRANSQTSDFHWKITCLNDFLTQALPAHFCMMCQTSMTSRCGSLRPFFVNVVINVRSLHTHFWQPINGTEIAC